MNQGTNCMFCDPTVEALENELAQLEKELADLKARWPAHSIKPSMLMQFEELEEKILRLYDILSIRRVGKES